MLTALITKVVLLKLQAFRFSVVKYVHSYGELR